MSRPGARRVGRWLLLAGLAGLATAVSGQVHRCVGADGKATYSDRPCDGSQRAAAAAPAAAPSAGKNSLDLDPRHESFRNLPEDKRREAFEMLVPAMLADRLTGLAERRAAFERHVSVTRTFYQGRDSAGTVYWSITCADGTSYEFRWSNQQQAYRMELEDCRAVRASNRAACFTSNGLLPGAPPPVGR